MKKIILLSLILVALWVTMIKTNAATPVPVSLTITGAINISCANSTGAGALGNIWASAVATSLTWVFSAGSWTCTDMRWTARTNTWQKVQSSSLTANGVPAIPASNVKMLSATVTTAAWNITWTTTLWTLTSIDSPQFVIIKSGITTIGTLTATPTLVVTIPAYQSPAAYTGLITVTDPS